MRRELSQLLDELYDGLIAIQDRQPGMRLSDVEVVLPIELRPVLRDGGCVLLAEFSRSLDVNAWTPQPSRLRVGWSEGAPTAAPAAASRGAAP